MHRASRLNHTAEHIEMSGVWLSLCVDINPDDLLCVYVSFISMSSTASMSVRRPLRPRCQHLPLTVPSGFAFPLFQSHKHGLERNTG